MVLYQNQSGKTNSTQFPSPFRTIYADVRPAKKKGGVRAGGAEAYAR